MEKVICRTPQEDKSLHFPFTSAASIDNSANDSDYHSSNRTSMNANNEVPIEHPKG